MNKKALFIKISLSLVIAGIAAAAIVSSWSPLLVTYVPIEQTFDVTPKSAEIMESILTSRNQVFPHALNVSTVLILINLIASLVIIWVAKFNGSENT
jgi:hypothetical protein